MALKSVVRWLLALAVLFAGSGAFAQQTPLQLTVGESRTLDFEGNPSTGYAWVLAPAEDGTHRIVAVDVRGYVPGATRTGERPRLGAPAPFQVLLTGVSRGRTTLTFHYVKAGTATARSSRSFAIEVLGEAAVQPPDVDEAQEDALDGPTSVKPADSKDDLFADPNDSEDGGGAPD